MNRRLLLSLIAGAVMLPRVGHALPAPPPLRRLHLVNAHTAETFEGTYRNDSGPIAPVLDELSVFLRDFHSGARVAIDVALLDFLAAVMGATGQTTATILSAYRTPETNATLARTHFGVAENSQHLYGRALDVHFGGNLVETMRAARAMQRGGVGWYPSSRFIHLDSGPVRNWDLDEAGLGTLLLGGRHIRFNSKGELVISSTGGRGRVPLMMHGNRPMTVRQRLARLRELARAEYLHRRH